MKRPIRYSRFLLAFLLLSRILLLPQTSYAEEKPTPAKLIGGILMTLGGIFLAADGFAQIETAESKSRPGLDISNWDWTCYYLYQGANLGYTYEVSADGTVKNTGKAPLDDVEIHVKYYDNMGTCVVTQSKKLDTYGSEPLPVGATDTWSTSRSGIYRIDEEPTSAEISATYSYPKLYETKSSTEGYAGIAMGVAGLYFIVDYLVDLGYLAKLEEKGIEVKLVTKPDSMYLLASARLF